MTASRPTLCLLFAAALALTGCRTLTGSNCQKPQAYEQAQDLPGLQIPAGMDAPDTRGALRIPALNEPEAPRRPDDPCLEEPPAYSNAPLTAPPRTPAPPPAPAEPPPAQD